MLASKMNFQQLHTLEIIYPGLIQHMKSSIPRLSKDGEIYCCSSGTDLTTLGIKGWGKTMKDAVEDWEKTYLQNL
jgi:hypothetical protein